jgi:sugar/nucleoside kinase (ribokinase family)
VSSALLFGPLSVDRYVDEGIDLPGGGVLNMAYHWAQRSVPFRLLSRIGDDHVELFRSFLDRHGIDALPSLVARGVSSSIDIVMRADRQPWMDHFVEGVWADATWTDDDRDELRRADQVHAVLVDAVATAVERFGAAGVLDAPYASGDFLSFRHYTVERFAATMQWLDLGFIGWPGSPDDAVIRGVRDVAFTQGSLVVVTLGADGVLLLDGRAGERAERFVPVQAVEVEGTTVGCGDSFIAAFLATWWPSHDLDAAVQAGMAAGAAATRWIRPLPDAAFALA